MIMKKPTRKNRTAIGSCDPPELEHPPPPVPPPSSVLSFASSDKKSLPDISMPVSCGSPASGRVESDSARSVDAASRPISAMASGCTVSSEVSGAGSAGVVSVIVRTAPLRRHWPPQSVKMTWTRISPDASCGRSMVDAVEDGGAPVSYTHLTLPTIYSV